MTALPGLAGFDGPSVARTGDRDAPLMAGVRRRVAVAAGAGTFGAIVLALLHVRSAGRPLNPLSSPISSYALTRDGWLFDLGVIGLAVGLVSLVSALVRSGCLATSSPPFAVMSTCCVGLVALVIFPDRTSHGGLTATGRTHWAVAMLTFGGLALAPTLLDHGRAPGCSRLPSVARRLSVTAASWFTLLLVGSVLEFVAALPRPLWHLGGLVERALVATEIIVAGVMTRWAWSGCPCISRADEPR